MRHDPEAPLPWDADRFAAEMAPYFEEHDELVFGPEARRHAHTRIRAVGEREGGERRWEVTQVMLDPEGDHLWHALGSIALSPDDELDGPLVELLHLGK